MRDANIKKLVLAALMAALTYVATSIVQIPSPMQGFVNLGDCIVLLSGWILGPWWGAAASIPGNLVQGAMGMVIGLVLLVVLKRSKALEKLA